MLNNARPLSSTQLGSALGGTSMMRPKPGGRTKRNAVAGLMLTSLVDAFSILVIFLIMNHSANNEIVNVGDKIKLPQAMDSQFIQNGVVVRIEGRKLMVEDKEISVGELLPQLKQLNSSAEVAKREGLIIVADRNMDFADLSPVILAGSQAGFTKFKFAVIRRD